MKGNLSLGLAGFLGGADDGDLGIGGLHHEVGLDRLHADLAVDARNRQRNFGIRFDGLGWVRSVGLGKPPPVDLSLCSASLE